MNKWHIFLFSFNRGIFLHNCLNSIETCIPDIDVTVIDDNSDDEETKKILEHIESDGKFDVIRPNIANIQKKRLGGLYENMNMAMRIAKEKNKTYVVFIQDDMQFVRKVNLEDLSTVETIFNSFEDIQQIQSCFLKRLGLESYEKKLIYKPNEKCYILDNKADDLSAFSDVGIFHAPRFEGIHKSFAAGERKNNEIALHNNIKLAQLELPFMMWLPYPTSYKRKKLNLKTLIIEKIAQCDFYPIDILQASQWNIMLNNNKSKLPIAETILTSDRLNNVPTWSFSYGVINLFARGGWRRKLALLLWKL